MIKFSVNTSDTTVSCRANHGWSFLTKRALHGITIYPTHSDDNNVLILQHGITLEQKMIPAVSFQNQKRVYAG